ncbi:MAG: recombination protein NinG [Janthinobacterium lividum]
MIRNSTLKRTGFKSNASGILRTANLPGAPVKPKMRSCKVCSKRFLQVAFNSLLPVWCSLECGAVLGLRLTEKNKLKAARTDRAQTRKQLEALKSIPTLKAEAQTACNAFIRYRDRNQPCICCNGMPLTNGALSGGSWDACHWKGRGSHDHLRYNEDNIHRGLKNCNTYGHKDYRGGLIARIGLARVEALESDQTIVKWTPDMLRSIRDGFKAKLKALMAANTEEGI